MIWEDAGDDFMKIKIIMALQSRRESTPPNLWKVPVIGGNMG